MLPNEQFKSLVVRICRSGSRGKFGWKFMDIVLIGCVEENSPETDGILTVSYSLSLSFSLSLSSLSLGPTNYAVRRVLETGFWGRR